MHSGPDPYALLGVAPGATGAAIHAAYRAAVRRTHPDAGGSAQAFEAVQDAYELLRDPARRRAWDGGHPAAATASRRSPPDPAAATEAMEDLLAESRRLEDEARALAGLGARPHGGDAAPGGDEEDSISAVLRDAGRQLSTTAAAWSRELSRILGRPR